MILSSEPDLKSLSAIKALICKLALLSFQFLPKKFKGIPKWSLISSPKSCPCPRFQKYVRVRDFKKKTSVSVLCCCPLNSVKPYVMAHNTYPWILKKSKTRDRDRARSSEKNQERSIASFCICSHVLGFLSENRARWWSQKWHIFLISTAYFSSYWHMLFEISIIILSQLGLYLHM